MSEHDRAHEPPMTADASVDSFGGQSSICTGPSSVSIEEIAGSLVPTVAIKPNPHDSKPPAAPASGALPLPPRFRDVGLLGTGAFGEVRRVYDAELDRTLAMKLLRADAAAIERVAKRFLAEAKLTAGLQHPGIVAVYDWGTLADGRLWFTMPEIRGVTFQHAMEELHEGRGEESGWTFRRLVDAFARACQAVAYAHRRGVVHRDLKPSNVMVGELGEVLVVDWGISMSLGGLDAAPADAQGSPQQTASAHLTQLGDVLGTPVYMPPEQALGERDLHGPPSDVYALGAILYHLLAGRPPYRGSAGAVWRQVIDGPPQPLREVEKGRAIPHDLASICARAMQRSIADRYPDAGPLALDLVAFLDGARRREQALAVLGKARAIEPAILRTRAEAIEKRAEARAFLASVRAFDPLEKKRPGWSIEDAAAALELDATVREAEWIATMEGALAIDPELPEAHAALADHYRDRLLEAERAYQDGDAIRAEARLRMHERGRYSALLRGEGALSLVTDPPGAEVVMERYAVHDRRLVPESKGVIGATPIREMPLPRGSYRLRIRAKGRAEVLYPVLIERGQHWDGCAPGDAEPTPILLPNEGELDPEDAYVPAGYAWIGGDINATDSLKAARIWADPFVIKRFAVTHREYLSFLNDLIARGLEEEAIAACPRAQLGMADTTGESLYYDRRSDGTFYASTDELGRSIHLDAPVILVSGLGAASYARWTAERTTVPWRLIDELEREKAARGADGRFCPWGNTLDASFACVVDAFEKNPQCKPVGSFPLDESPYGVRDLSGNSRDWCCNVWRREGPLVDGGRLVVVEAPWSEEEIRAVRGGAWSSALNFSRAATRFGLRSTLRRTTTGLRIARSYPN